MNWFLDLQPATQAAVVAAAVSLIVAFFNPLTSRRIEQLKNELSEKLEHTKAALQTDLALTKAALDEQASAKNARQAYEFDARKRLYAELEPLLFQLFDASEGSYFRVKSLVRTQREGHLGRGENSWLSNDGYYLISTIYRIFLPLSIFRLIQKSATFVDLNLDQSIRTRYYLLRQAYLTFTDDFVMAKQSPELEYNPNNAYAQSVAGAQARHYWRQGLVIGHIDRLLDSLLISEGETRRPLTYGEFEDAVRPHGSLSTSIETPYNLFYEFSFFDRPVFARILCAHACLMHLLIINYDPGAGAMDLMEEVRQFLASDNVQRDLRWWAREEDDPTMPVIQYLSPRLAWHSSQRNEGKDHSVSRHVTL